MSEKITPDEAIEECLRIGAQGISLGLAKQLQAERDSLRAENARLRSEVGGLYPVSYTQHSLGLYQVAIWTEDGKTLHRPGLVSQLAAFAKSWSANLRNQGFLKAAMPQGAPVLASRSAAALKAVATRRARAAALGVA
jgi:hypothetical protein